MQSIAYIRRVTIAPRQGEYLMNKLLSLLAMKQAFQLMVRLPLYLINADLFLLALIMLDK